ncbi:hypothetical protein BU14_0550s0001 [Porphyra umbilicalis]|uniref:Uncharacterized protein n=1 Tax=Porphyra umbilicalis TaxID=2786 RepID=A0A1X6NRX3_PORUM|nr:hypothetical protein BU14_0550s0001 [Porphyra umbilicalis]|eukprot:OSX71338.1 hypothetical protein BU14_0550s0001 [Porphyra umbilicalis]
MERARQRYENSMESDHCALYCTVLYLEACRHRRSHGRLPPPAGVPLLPRHDHLVCHVGRVPPPALPVATDAAADAELLGATKALRDLLYRADSSAAGLWWGPALDAAILRYERVFLPLLAAHLDATGAVALRDGHPATAEVRRLRAAAERRYKTSAAAAVASPAGKKRADLESWASLAKDGNIAAGPALFSVRPIPPLDVALCWLLHRLNPAAYVADCERLFGVALPVPASWPLAAAVAHGHAGNAGEPPVATARLQWALVATAARDVEAAHRSRMPPFRHRRHVRPAAAVYTPAYLAPPTVAAAVAAAAPGAPRPRLPPAAAVRRRWVSRLAFDLPAAAGRARRFVTSVVGPEFTDGAFLARGVRRYRQFIALKGVHPDTFLTVMYDMDLVWHAHLASTDAYAAHCVAVAGRVVPHKEEEDRSEGGVLETALADTADRWAAAFGGEAFVLPATGSRGNPPAAAGPGQPLRGGYWPRGCVAPAGAAGAAALAALVADVQAGGGGGGGGGGGQAARGRAAAAAARPTRLRALSWPPPPVAAAARPAARLRSSSARPADRRGGDPGGGAADGSAMVYGMGGDGGGTGGGGGRLRGVWGVWGVWGVRRMRGGGGAAPGAEAAVVARPVVPHRFTKRGGWYGCPLCCRDAACRLPLTRRSIQVDGPGGSPMLARPPTHGTTAPSYPSRAWSGGTPLTKLSAANLTGPCPEGVDPRRPSPRAARRPPPPPARRGAAADVAARRRRRVRHGRGAARQRRAAAAARSAAASPAWAAGAVTPPTHGGWAAPRRSPLFGRSNGVDLAARPDFAAAAAAAAARRPPRRRQ